MEKDDYLASLERKLATKSDRLEEVHLEAAIDAQLTDCDAGKSPDEHDGTTKSSADSHQGNSQQTQSGLALFNDYVNPYAVSNCLSPYVPASAERISAFISFVSLQTSQGSDVLLDIGCGDGRVCVAVAKLTGCRAVGLDVSPACIESAKELALEENVDDLCQFFQTDATLDPEELMGGGNAGSALSVALDAVTVVWLFTYPTLLRRLVPLLSRLCRSNVRIVTLTYHFSESEAHIERKDSDNDLRLYSDIHYDRS